MRPPLEARRHTSGSARGEADEPAWRSFERAATRYEAWNRTRQGERASRAERLLLERLLAYARDLPLADRSVDLVLLVTVLEFVDRPAEVVAEAVRVARRGVLVIAFNRWSRGALSRRWGPASAGSLTSRAVDFSLPELRKLLETAAGARFRALEWESALFPCLSRLGPMRVPAGDVPGFALVLEPGS